MGKRQARRPATESRRRAARAADGNKDRTTQAAAGSKRRAVPPRPGETRPTADRQTPGDAACGRKRTLMTQPTTGSGSWAVRPRLRGARPTAGADAGQYVPRFGVARVQASRTKAGPANKSRRPRLAKLPWRGAPLPMTCGNAMVHLTRTLDSPSMHKRDNNMQ